MPRFWRAGETLSGLSWSGRCSPISIRLSITWPTISPSSSYTREIVGVTSRTTRSAVSSLSKAAAVTATITSASSGRARLITDVERALGESHAEDVRDRLRGSGADVVHGDRPVELARHRRERVPVEPARGDPLRE